MSHWKGFFEKIVQHCPNLEKNYRTREQNT